MIQGKGGFIVMDLCNVQEVRQLLARHGFHFSKSMGQNFLIDPAVPAAIADASEADKAVVCWRLVPASVP